MSVGVATRARAGGALALIALVIFAPATRADEELAALRGRLEQIKALVEDFDKRLKALELARVQPAATPGVTTSVPASPGPAAARAVAAPVTTVAPTAAAIDAATPVVPRVAWRRVREGLTESEVQALIGPPTKVFELAGKTVWYYYYPSVGAGSVFFSSRGVASSVQRPSGGG